jgi:lysophospholipase L1-like esterase
MFTDKQIVLLTPLHRALFDANDKNVQPDERVQNLCGEYLDAYVESVKEAGNIWSVPVVDLNATSGLYPLVNGTTYFHTDKDLLHPNDAGQDRMARTLMYQLLSLPCKFGN